MSQRIFPCRRKRDGTRVIPPVQFNRGSSVYKKISAEVAKNNETRRKIDEQIYKFETHFLEEASKIAYFAKALRTSSRSLEAIDSDRIARRGLAVIKPRDRIFSRSSYTSPLYQPGGPLHHELLALTEKTEPSIAEETAVRADSPDFSMLELSQPANIRRRDNRDSSSDEEDDDQDGAESIMDDVSEGTAQDDDDNFEDEMDDDGDDSASGVYSPARRMSRMRMSSGSLSPSLIPSRRRATNTDADFPVRARRGSSKITKQRRR